MPPGQKTLLVQSQEHSARQNRVRRRRAQKLSRNAKLSLVLKIRRAPKPSRNASPSLVRKLNLAPSRDALKASPVRRNRGQNVRRSNHPDAPPLTERSLRR
jgi:hypothetical protein